MADSDEEVGDQHLESVERGSDHGGSGSEGAESPVGSPRSYHGSDDEAGTGSHHSRRSNSGSEIGSPPGTPAGSDAGSRSGSGASRASSASGSPVRSRSYSPRSGSPGSVRSGSPAGSVGSGSPPRSRSGSPQSVASGSPAHSAGSGSPARSAGSGSPRSVQSGSPAHSARSVESPPRSPGVGSPRSAHSGSPRSVRSGSPRSVHSGSPRSVRSGSPRSIHSGSPRSVRSGSPQSAGSGSPARSTASGSPARSASPQHSAASGSPRLDRDVASPAGSDADSDSRRKRPREEDSASDDEEGIERKRKKKAVTSGSEAGSDKEDDDVVGATADDLFGDASDISSDDDDKPAGARSRSRSRSRSGDERMSGDEAVNQHPLIDDEEEEEQGPAPETRIEVEIPRINANLGKNLHYVKLPNFLSVETRPFDPSYYEDEIDEDEVLDEEGRTRMKLKVENTIRWRYKKDEWGNDAFEQDGTPAKESNARVVRWSDGSMSLNLGNEVFDIHTMLIQGDYNHLFIRQGTGLQGQAVFKTKLTFRPHSTDSFTHRKMTLSMADRATKTQKIRVLPIAGKDPEAHKTEMIKKEEERLRASIKRESQQRRVREKAHSRGLSTGYLEGEEDEDDEGAISLSAIKKQFKPGQKSTRPNIYSSDSDSESDDAGRTKRLMKAKKIVESDEEDSDTDMKKKRARALDSDEEDEGDQKEAASGGESGGSAPGSPARSGTPASAASDSD